MRKLLWMSGWMLSTLAWALVADPAAAQTGERIALVVGNANYAVASLANPHRDAEAMAALLTRAGFMVDKQLDTDLPQLRAAVDRFGSAIRNPSVKFGLFYFAGHGLQQDWRNYLVPVSANIRMATDVPQQTVELGTLLQHMGQAQGRSFLVILDACRDDPFAGSFRPPAKGLSQFDAPVGSLLAFATSPGNVAVDGVSGQNGLYTGFLLQEFAIPGTRIEDAFKRVRLNVRLASKGAQIPWESTSLEEDMVLFPGQTRVLTEAEQDRSLEREMASWLLAKGTSDPARLAEFIREYPSGNTSELAQSRLNRLFAALQAQETQRVRDAAEKARIANLQADQVIASQQTASRLEQARTDAAQAGQARPPAQSERSEHPGGASAATVQMLEPTPYFKGYTEHLRVFRTGDEFNIRVIDQFTKSSKPLVMRVTQVDENADRVVYNHGEFVSDLMGNTSSNQRGVFSTPRQFYPAELAVGKKWRTRFKQSRANGVAYTYQYDVKVVARERVTVLAGTFDTYKIEARGFNLELGAYLERNIWVAPGVNADIVHEIKVRLRGGAIEQNDRQELVSFVQSGR